MTSTKFNVGLSDEPRSSSRVLRPPGGGHTDIFGGDPEPPRGRRLAPNVPDQIEIGNRSEMSKPAANGQEPNQAAPEPAQTAQPSQNGGGEPKPPAANNVAANNEAPKRVKKLNFKCSSEYRYLMEHSKQSKLLVRILNKLKGDRFSALEKKYSAASTSMSNSVESLTQKDVKQNPINEEATTSAEEDLICSEDNFDHRYGGQYLTPEQLPAFCDQLSHLVEVVRNIQSYGAVTGEYPTEMERRLEHEAREVSALAAEARNARDVVARAKAQRKALREHKTHLITQIEALRESEMRELECTVRLSDRKLYKSWETLKDSRDPNVFEPLLDEIRNKQTALECLVRLIEARRTNLTKNRNLNKTEALSTELSRRRQELQNNLRRGVKRKRNGREANSAPLSNEPSRLLTSTHGTTSSTYRVDENGAVTVTTLELPSRGSVRDIFLFTTDN